MLLLRSGRFAAGLFQGGDLVLHKCLKRYTVRRGQGGSQAAMDGTGRKPKSAGAMLRGAACDLVRSWPNVSEVTVKGTRFIYEGSDEEIGPTITNCRAS